MHIVFVLMFYCTHGCPVELMTAAHLWAKTLTPHHLYRTYTLRNPCLQMLFLWAHTHKRTNTHTRIVFHVLWALNQGCVSRKHR